MSFLTTVPLIFGYPMHIWLGIILGILLTIQIIAGLMTVKGHAKYFKIHRVVWIFIAIIALIHMYYGLGLWFFHFTIK